MPGRMKRTSDTAIQKATRRALRTTAGGLQPAVRLVAPAPRQHDAGGEQDDHHGRQEQREVGSQAAAPREEPGGVQGVGDHGPTLAGAFSVSAAMVNAPLRAAAGLWAGAKRRDPGTPNVPKVSL